MGRQTLPRLEASQPLPFRDPIAAQFLAAQLFCRRCSRTISMSAETAQICYCLIAGSTVHGTLQD